jgi:hypothetical protein
VRCATNGRDVLDYRSIGTAEAEAEAEAEVEAEADAAPEAGTVGAAETDGAAAVSAAAGAEAAAATGAGGARVDGSGGRCERPNTVPISLSHAPVNSFARSGPRAVSCKRVGISGRMLEANGCVALARTNDSVTDAAPHRASN